MSRQDQCYAAKTSVAWFMGRHIGIVTFHMATYDAFSRIMAFAHAAFATTGILSQTTNLPV